MSFKEFIEGFCQTAETYIKKYEEIKGLSGEEKKARLDDVITVYVNTGIEKLPVNFVFKFVLKKVLVQNIPTITQMIFNLIKLKVEGITK